MSRTLPIDAPLGFGDTHGVECACPEAPTTMADCPNDIQETDYDHVINPGPHFQRRWCGRAFHERRAPKGVFGGRWKWPKKG